jgi:hypothetical protein
VKKTLSLSIVLVLALAIVGFGQSLVKPRVLDGGVLLFDNDSGSQVSKIGIVFDKAVKLQASDFLAVGGQGATLVAASNNFVFVDVVVVSGGTLQIILPSEYADALVTNAFWFE